MKPLHLSLSTIHCVIVPLQHIPSTLQADEEVTLEIERYKSCLRRLFEADGKIPLFVETSCHHSKSPHACIDVIPIKAGLESDARMYFTEAFNNCDEEWAQHKKLIYVTTDRPLKNAIPKHFPYISIEWSECDDKRGSYGLAHAIENDSRFSSDFCLDVIAGMLKKDPMRTRYKLTTDIQKEKSRIEKIKEAFDHYDWVKYMNVSNED